MTALLTICVLFWQIAPDSILVKFIYSGKAEKVAVAGSFNNWSDSALPMVKSGEAWSVSKKLAPGYYYYKLVADGVWFPDPSHSWRVNDGGSSWNSILKVGEPEIPKRIIRNAAYDSTLLPAPYFPARPDLVQLYYAAWRMAWQKIQQGTRENGFVPDYMDEGFNELIYQWDTCFMTAFGVFGNGLFPAMASLDNFYQKQREDGYIQRVYFELDGRLANPPTVEEPMVNPPLFAWLELRYYRLTGDDSRLKSRFVYLDKYFTWLDKNIGSTVSPDLYYNSELGSGMDNTPRPGVKRGGWIDQSAQMALFAKMMREIAVETGNKSDEVRYAAHYKRISAGINEKMWSPSSGFYHDLSESGQLSPVMHIGAFWTLLSGTAGKSRTKILAEKLSDPRFFNRPHRVPTLSFSDPLYKSDGHYWLGGIWAPTNYMVIQGLNQNGFRKLADSIAWNHVQAMSIVYKSGIADAEKIPFEQRFQDGYHTIWEAYAPEKMAPATRWDNTFYTRQDFTGWSALGPIAIFIEQLIGLEPELSDRRITWHLTGRDARGIKNLKLGKFTLDLLAEPVNGAWNFTVSTNHSLELRVSIDGKIVPLNLTPQRKFYSVKIPD